MIQKIKDDLKRRFNWKELKPLYKIMLLNTVIWLFIADFVNYFSIPLLIDFEWSKLYGMTLEEARNASKPGYYKIIGASIAMFILAPIFRYEIVKFDNFMERNRKYVRVVFVLLLIALVIRLFQLYG